MTVMAAANSASRKHWMPKATFCRHAQKALALIFISLILRWNVVEETTVITESETFKLVDSKNELEDFPTRARTVPRNEWPRLDNQTCLPEDLPEYAPEGSLQRRMPHAIIMGSMKSGTTALSLYLYEHPSVVMPKRKEVHFFDFQYEQIASADGIHRGDARYRYRNAFAHALGEEAMSLLQNNASLLAIDDSPRYIFWSDRVPARILCVAPWAKILAIFRNPVDRAFSHFNMQANSIKAGKMKQKPTFEEWIEMDMDRLKETGVIQDQIPLKDFSGSAEEMEAWKKYTRIGRHAPLGRGLYAIQLRHWFKTYEEFGKSRSDFFIIQSERMRNDKNDVYAEMLEFLELEPYQLEQETEPNSGNYEVQMSNKTRKMLEKFYKPYNRELYKLLGKEWKGVWDP
jgi:hypothetical protein